MEYLFSNSNLNMRTSLLQSFDLCTCTVIIKIYESLFKIAFAAITNPSSSKKKYEKEINWAMLVCLNSLMVKKADNNKSHHHLSCTGLKLKIK